ncbi:DUF4288 domain-containing protein [Haliangium sp.]|uniref:DUF4288 domain-containing protein n=1 Tax=Haliangium sp. TaxID=2663208 RepID=UPI003D0C0C03
MPTDEDKDLYIAVLLFESVAPSGSKESLFQETFVLLRAADEGEARAQALAHGRRSCTSYENAAGETIQWTLKHLVDVTPVLDDELTHGSELYARHFKNYQAYRDFEPLLDGRVD